MALLPLLLLLKIRQSGHQDFKLIHVSLFLTGGQLPVQALSENPENAAPQGSLLFLGVRLPPLLREGDAPTRIEPLR